MSVAQRQRDSASICKILSCWLRPADLTASALGGSGQLPVVAGFWPLPGEPDLTDALRTLDTDRIPIVLPVMTGRGRPLEFHRWRRDDALIAGPFGVMQPVPGQALVPDILLVPTLGYTRQADRLGYGAGFYDRTLATLQQSGHLPLAVGIGWREGLIPAHDAELGAYHPQPHDVPLAAILTPDGWIPEEPRKARPS